MINPLNISFHKKVACAYEEMKHTPNEHETRQAYLHLSIETINQYQQVLRDGLQVEFGSYRVPLMALNDIKEHNHLFVFPTSDNFGSDQSFNHKGNPLLNFSGFYISDKPARINDLFRVVHDYYGHALPGNGFGPKGEENAFRSHVKMFSTSAGKALATETRGQNSWVNFGPHAEHNKTNKQDTIFANQKTGLLPNFAMELY